MVGEPCLNLVGETALGVLGAVIARLSMLITNDSGPAHIAYALRTLPVTIFGGDARFNGSLQPGQFRVLAHPVPRRPCQYGRCPVSDRWLKGVAVSHVVAQAEELLSTDD